MTREEAIKCLIDAKEEFEYFHNHCVAFDMAIEALKQPGRKSGKWKKNDNGTYSCSLCQSWIPSEQHYYARYCLYCGAKMEVD